MVQNDHMGESMIEWYNKEPPQKMVNELKLAKQYS
jgi:hypothetical protein